MNILEFYRRCESKYEDLPVAQCFNKDDVEKTLRDAKPGALLQLTILFNDDEKLMFYMLQYLLTIPQSLKLHKDFAEVKKKASKKISQKKSRFQDKVEKRVEDFISLYRALNPDVDYETLKDMAYYYMKMDKSLRLEAELLNEIIKNHKKGKTWQGKTNVLFKDIIYNTSIIAKGKSDNIAKLLHCLNFKTPQGKTYTKNNIEHHCKTPSR